MLDSSDSILSRADRIMENDDSKHENKALGSTPAAQWNDLGFNVRSESASHFGIPNTAASNNMPIPSALIPLSTFPHGVRQVTPQLQTEERPLTSFHSMTDLSQFRTSQTPRPYSNSPCWKGDNPMDLNNLISHASYVNGLQNQHVSNRFVPVRDNPASSLPTSGMGGSVNTSNLLMPEPIRSFASPECRTPALCHTSDGEVIGINSNFMTTEVQQYLPQKLDGNFLTLGIGGTMEAMSKCNISGRNISSNDNQMVIFPQPNTSYGQGARSSSYPSFNIASSSFPGFQNSVNGWTFPRNDPRVMSGVNSGLLSNPHYTAETPQGNEKHDLFVPNNFAFGITGNTDIRFAGINLNYDNQGHTAKSSVPGSIQVGLPDYRESRKTGLPLVSNLSRTSTQPAVGQSQNHHMETVGNSWSEPSMVLPLNTRIMTGNTYLQDQSGGFRELPLTVPLQSSSTLIEAVLTGQQIPVTNVNRICQASSVSTQPSLKRGASESSEATFHSQRRRTRKSSVGPSIPTQIQRASPPPNLCTSVSHTVLAHPALSSPHQANSNTLFRPLPLTGSLLSIEPQIASSLPLHPNRSVLLPPSWPSSRPPQHWAAPPFPPQPPTASPFPIQHRTAQPPFPPQPQAAPRFPIQPRTAQSFPTRPRSAPPFPPQPQAAPSVQLQSRKVPRLAPQSKKASTRPSQLQSAPPLQGQSPTTSSSHIKWQDLDQTSQTIGHKCLICKRDLSFTPEGPVYQPSAPPPAAILPCGHTFHDHCLQLITPQDQTKNPPCIPCVMGES